MTVSDIPASIFPAEKKDWLQSLRRVFRTLPITERQEAIHLLQQDLKETEHAPSSAESLRLDPDHPAWDALNLLIQEDRDSERKAVDAAKTAAITPLSKM